MGRDERGEPVTGPTGRGGDGSSGTIEGIHEILSSRRRQYVLYHLVNEGGELDLSGLSSRVVESEYGRNSADLPVDVRQRTYLDLYHKHVPKLDEFGIVEYSDEDGLVTLVATNPQLFAQLEQSLDRSLDGPD